MRKALRRDPMTGVLTRFRDQERTTFADAWVGLEPTFQTAKSVRKWEAMFSSPEGEEAYFKSSYMLKTQRKVARTIRERYETQLRKGRSHCMFARVELDEELDAWNEQRQNVRFHWADDDLEPLQVRLGLDPETFEYSVKPVPLAWFNDERFVAFLEEFLWKTPLALGLSCSIAHGGAQFSLSAKTFLQGSLLADDIAYKLNHPELATWIMDWPNPDDRAFRGARPGAQGAAGLAGTPERVFVAPATVVASCGFETAVADPIVTEPGPREIRSRSRPIRDLGLTIAGTQIEPLIAELLAEVERAGVRRLKPRFYLSTEWGVPTGTIAIAIPFYLANPELTALHAERVGYVEGSSVGDILRYLRHEMGHAVNYAYRLYDDPEWVRRFGSFTRPYREDHRPQPFSRRYVRHLPGWYAQMHPEEDWAETFAVWLTPGRDRRSEYAGWPAALGKLEYCDRVLKELGDREPLVSATDPDVDVSEVEESLDRFYGDLSLDKSEFPPELDGELRLIFEDLGAVATPPASPDKAAAALIRRHEGALVADIYRWTGHFPEDSSLLLRHLAERADHLRLGYSGEFEYRVIVGLTTLVTALAMNHVHTGTYFP